MNLLDGNGPLLIGHKGAGGLEPENTLASLARAVELGCDAVEFDVLEVEGLEAPGLVLGIESGQPYEELRRPFAPGDAVVLYTDGVVESRNAGELYGTARLDSFLAENRELSAQALAEAVVEESRRFAGGVLTDDCAVVVLRRTG